MECIKHLLHINAPKETIYKALTTIEGLSNWWTIQTSGDTSVGGIIQFRFGDMGPDMQVTASEPFTLVSWHCTAGIPDWIGTDFTFKLDDNDNKTRLRFEQSGWREANDFYAGCSFTWAGIWKACANIAKREQARLLEAKRMESKCGRTLLPIKF